MNERIKELAEQAYQWAVNESKRGPNICAPGSDYFLAMEKKKFAELIVEECMEQVWYSREDGINGNISQVIKDRIKEHFGVKE